jgi:uracil-DNA glycosylase
MPSLNFSAQWQSELDLDYMKELSTFLKDQLSQNKVIYPEPKNFFRALEATPFETVKVVILGQDPYHGPHQAHGLSFSVQHGVPKPPSLVNIFKELHDDLGIATPTHGCLDGWAKQGVLLLNAVLSVEAGRPGSHAGKGWERFTDAVIRSLSMRKEPVCFVLWGSYAQKKKALIDLTRHHVIMSVHPSPLSAYRGFFGSKPFSKINQFCKANNYKPIHWNTTEALAQNSQFLIREKAQSVPSPSF